MHWKKTIAYRKTNENNCICALGLEILLEIPLLRWTYARFNDRAEIISKIIGFNEREVLSQAVRCTLKDSRLLVAIEKTRGNWIEKVRSNRYSFSALDRSGDGLSLCWAFSGESLRRSRMCSTDVVTCRRTVKGELTIGLGSPLDLSQASPPSQT